VTYLVALGIHASRDIRPSMAKTVLAGTFCRERNVAAKLPHRGEPQEVANQQNGTAKQSGAELAPKEGGPGVGRVK